MKNIITHKDKTHTVIAESKTNVGKLAVTLDNGIVTKWVSKGGALKPVASGPVESHRKWDDAMAREAATHSGAWWEDHKAQLMAMTWVALNQ